MTMKGDAKFKWKLTYFSWQGIWLIFMWAVESLKICFWWVPFVKSLSSCRWKSTEELSFMKLESAAKFEENCFLVSTSSGKSENLRFDGLLLSIAYNYSAKKAQKSYLSGHWRMIQTLKKSSLFVWKMTW